MAGKTLIGGTPYTVTGGKTLIGGTEYSIARGKTLIGGTEQTIEFSNVPTLKEIFDSSVFAVNGYASRNNSTTGTVGIPKADGLYLVFWKDHFSLVKTSGTTATVLFTTASENVPTLVYERETVVKEYFYLSLNGTSKVNVYGASIFFVSFGSYTEEEVIACFGACNLKASNGREASTTNATNCNITNVIADGIIIIAAVGGKLMVGEIVDASTNRVIAIRSDGTYTVDIGIASEKEYAIIKNSGSQVSARGYTISVLEG